MGIIKELMNSGNIVLYHDYRMGHFNDMSVNGFNGTPTDVSLTNIGFQNGTSATAGVSVADNALLRLTSSSTIVLFGNFIDNAGSTTLMAKNTAEFQLRVASANLRLYNSTLPNTSDFTGGYSGKKYIGININAGAAPNLYLDGIFTSNGNANFTVSSGTNALSIGSYGSGGLGSLKNIFSACLIFNRVLTATEHARLYNELMSMNAIKSKTSRFNYSSTDTYRNFKTNFGINNSIAIEGGEIGKYLSNSPFQFGDTTGRYKISTEKINGCIAKVIECTTAGLLYIPNTIFNETASESAYGTWEWWMKSDSGGATTPRVIFISTIVGGMSASGQYGYDCQFRNPNGIFYFQESVNGSISDKFYSANGTITKGTWYKIKVSRTAGGVTSCYLNNILTSITGGGGANPYTDTTTTASNYFILDLDAGDKFAIASQCGTYNFTKYLGVI